MSGGGKLNRTETVTVRLDPCLNYLAELAGRSQRRTKSSFIEWAVSQAIGDVFSDKKATLLWRLTPAQRLEALYEWAPELLTFDEQCLIAEARAKAQSDCSQVSA